MPPEVLTVAQARAAGLGKSYPATTEGDALLEGRILAEEQRVRKLIGQLTGERTYVTREPYVWLPRPTDAITSLSVDGTASDPSLYELVGRQLKLVSGDTWADTRKVVTFTPNDVELVRTVLIELLRLSLSDTGMQSESIRGYSYSRGGVTRTSGTAQRRLDVMAPLLPNDGIGV